MKSRPRLIWISASLIFFSGLLTLSEVFLGGVKSGWHHWILLLLAPWISILVVQTSTLLLTLLPIYIALYFWHSFSLLESGFLALSLSTLTTALLGAAPLLSNKVRQLVLDPKKRWWVTPRRTVISLGTRISPVTGGDLFAQSFDLSETGVFISLRDPLLREEKIPELSIGTHCALRINLNQYTYLACSGQIVRSTAGGGKYPTGIGIRFVGLSRKQKEYLTHYLKGPSATDQSMNHASAIAS